MEIDMSRNSTRKIAMGRVTAISIFRSILWVGFILILTPAAISGPTPTPKSPKGKGVPDKKVENKDVAKAKAPATAKAKVARKTDKSEEATTTPDAGAHKIQINARHVYLGRYRSFRKPATLDTQKVFEAISYYQDVKRSGLTKKNGRYWILIQKSNRIFHKALRRLARREGFDLIGARDAIMIDGNNPTDVTDSLVDLIPSISLD
jgi:hypothetical protein